MLWSKQNDLSQVKVQSFIVALVGVAEKTDHCPHTPSSTNITPDKSGRASGGSPAWLNNQEHLNDRQGVSGRSS
jgi:hypothetical protein